MFAVIKTGGKQYRVVANQLVKVEKIVGNAGDIIEFNDIFMVAEGDNTIVGTPTVSDALVTAEIVEQGRARKVIAFKKRRRQNSKRTRGHRQEITTLRILEILTGGAKPKKSAESTKVKDAKPSKKATAKTAEEKSQKTEAVS